MTYHIDTSKYSLLAMKKDLLGRELIPSRRSLKDDLDVNFRILTDRGILSLGDLISVLKTKKKVQEFSSSSGISETYLILLRREANSYLPNPVSLDRFSGFAAGDINKLADVGIKNSRHLFEKANKISDPVVLAEDFGVSLDTLSQLVGMSDLVRAYGVGPAFARILYDCGIHSVNEFRDHTPRQVIDLYQKKTGKKADFSASDIKFSLDLVQVLDIE